ncbi:MAG: ExbD/TolR family protein [Bacteroidota bacterium]|jgi:biopolymer transport protein ExbD|nr:biopolymer transporter ExbD [Bacteroidota bacterium]MCA6444753.1 biopolymer transporter ExbD [Bacteroidota bacterium]
MGLRKKHREAEVSTDSLNDIMFFLLLFFLILSTMVSPNSIKINLAKSTTKNTIDSKDNKPIHLAVTKDKKYYINNKEIPEANLETEISTYSAKQIDPILFMHLDRDLPIQVIADIMTMSMKLKVKPVLATAPNK